MVHGRREEAAREAGSVHGPLLPSPPQGEGGIRGPKRDDAAKKHPDLVPYADLPESEKQYDRNAAMETLKAIVALGYRFVPRERSGPGQPRG